MVRDGKTYISALDDGRTVYLGGKQVDVASEPAFEGSIRGIAGYFDWQRKFADECLVTDPETGEPMNVSHMIPRNSEDLERRHKGLERLARYSYGMLGRTPDYVNVSLSGHVAREDLFAKGDKVFHDRIAAFRREVIDRDLALTHTIVHASIDKGVGELEGMNSDLTLKVVKRDSNGITVRGAKILATLGPLADENYVYPGAPLKAGEEDYALCFSLPMNAKGLKTICRDHYGIDAAVEDHPFSSRFDEQDAFLIFDDVEIPWERVFVDGNLEVYNALPLGTFPGNVLQQTAIRAATKLEFAYDLGCQVARVTNSLHKPDVSVLLGEILSYARITRMTIAGAEARAYDWGSGAFWPHQDLSVLRGLMPGWMVRVNEILKTLGSHNLLCTPTSEAFANPELAPFLDRYLPGAGGIDARERATIMRTAWDFAGSALGSRMELYERFYLTSVQRNRMLDHMLAQKAGVGGEVAAFLKESGVLVAGN